MKIEVNKSNYRPKYNQYSKIFLAKREQWILNFNVLDCNFDEKLHKGITIVWFLFWGDEQSLLSMPQKPYSMLTTDWAQNIMKVQTAGLFLTESSLKIPEGPTSKH